MTFQNGLTTTVSGEMVLLTVPASQFRSENPKEYELSYNIIYNYITVILNGALKGFLAFFYFNGHLIYGSNIKVSDKTSHIGCKDKNAKNSKVRH